MPNGGLGDRIAKWILRWIPDWWEDFTKRFIEAEDSLVDLVWHHRLPEAPPEFDKLIKEAQAGTLDIEDIYEFVNYAKEHPTPANVPPMIWYYMALMLIYVAGASGPAQRLAGYKADTALSSARLDPASAVTAWWREALSLDARNMQLAEQGFSLDNITAIVNSMIPLLRDEQEMEAWLRGDLSDGDLVTRMEHKGYQPSDISLLQRLAYPIPPVPDLITMAVREAFTPEIVAKYGLHADFPPDFATWAERKGLTPEWALNYWASHWVLPSLTMGYDMLHRGVITRGDLETLLRTQDIMPFWRDKLIQVSFSPLTRVDTRRMEKLGVIDAEEVYRAYLDQGYDDEKARWMTEFTIKYNEGEDRELTKAVILEAYRARTKPRDWAIERLMRLDYREENARLYIALEDYEYAKETKEEYLKNYKLQYVEGLWDLATLREHTGTLGLPATEERRYIDLWTLERDRRASRPTTTQLGKFYDQGIIPEQTYFEQMRFRGYSPEMIGWYVQDIEIAQRERLEKLTDKEKQVEVIKKAYPSKTELRLWLTAGIITEPRYREVLYERGYSTEFIDHYVEQIMVEELETRGLDTLEELTERKRRIAHPTRADLKAFLKVGIMTMEEVGEELALQDFHPDMIRYYIELWTAEEEE